MLRRLGRLCFDLARSAVSARWSAAALAAICLATVCQQSVVLLGTTPPVATVLTMGAVLGLLAGCFLRQRWTFRVTPGGDALCQLALLAWVVATPWWLGLADHLLSRPALADPVSPFGLATTTSILCLALTVIPALLAAWGAAARPDDSPPLSKSPLLFGAATGLLLWTCGLAQIMGPWPCGLAAATGGLALALCRLRRPSIFPAPASTLQRHRDWPRQEHRETPANPPPASATTDMLRPAALWWSLAGPSFDFFVALLLGGLLAATVRLLEQLQPATIHLASTVAIGCLLGAAAGRALVAARRVDPVSTWRWRFGGLLAAAAWGMTLLAAYPQLVEGSLWLNSSVSSAALLLAARGALAGLAVAPLGGAFALCTAGSARWGRSSHSAQRSLPPAAWWVCGLAGYCLIAPAGARGWSIPVTMAALAWSLAIFATLSGGFRVAWPAGRLPRFAMASLGLGLAGATILHGNFDPRLSARLLFNTNVFLGYRSGFPQRLLPHLDEARHLATFEGARGITTVWSYGGRQLQIRENGLPAGVASCDPQVFPRLAAESLPAALPLILHEQPQSLLLLGVGTGESLSAALEFPLTEISCWEADATRVRLLREALSEHSQARPLDDDRLHWMAADPTLALDSEPGLFDAVVSLPEHAGLLRSQCSFTESYYRRAARRLSPGGIFCQRLQIVDLGPRPVQDIVRTVQAVFPDALALEVAPGELLLAASTGEAGTLRPRLVERLQRPHVRAVLAQSGLDWSVILNLPAWRNDGLADFAAAGVRGPNSAANSRLTFSLPLEVLRWGPKSQEVHAALAPHAGRLADFLGEEGSSPMVVRRLAEVTAQRDLMAKYADQYWSYRASLRKQLLHKPRSMIEQVSATTDRRQMHPEDLRRKNYFVALGRAAGSRDPFDIRRLEQFAAPYDPLISYFAHVEAAELYARSDRSAATDELRHRLHAVWFSSPRDASLQNVVAALALVREYPNVVADPALRWDTLNALLQALQQRWAVRSGTQPTDVKRVIRDIDATLSAAEATFAAMEAVTREAHLPAELWSARREALERTLVSPVKSYRSAMLPHLHRQAGKAADAVPNEGPPSDERTQ